MGLMTVRQARREDARDIATMLWAFNTEFDTWVPDVTVLERHFVAMLARDDVAVVMAEDPGPAGFGLVTLRPSPYYAGPVASLDEMYVVPARRGHGLGGAIIELVLRLLRDRSCGELQINVDEEDEGARRFYERHGFTNVQPGSTDRMLCYLQEL